MRYLPATFALVASAVAWAVILQDLAAPRYTLPDRRTMTVYPGP